MSTQIRSKSLPEVIVRSWGDEPVVLVAHGLESKGKWVLVGKATAKRPIGLPASDVFDYDEQQFALLAAAYSIGDKEELSRLYDEMRGQNKSSEGACNKYQYLLKSINHEKPEVTNTRSSADSGQQ